MESQLIKDYKAGISICYIGASGTACVITNIKKISENSYFIACENGVPFTVTPNKIHYTGVVI